MAATAGLIGSNILIFLGLFSLAPALPAVRGAFAGAANVDLLTQLVGAMSGFTFALGSFGMGPLITRFGYRRVYIISLLAFALAGAGGAALHDLYSINVTRAIVGIACAGVVNAALVAIGELVPPAAQSRLLGVQALIGGISAIVLFPIIGRLGGIDWRLAFAVHLVALLFIPLVLALPAAPPFQRAGAAQPRGRSVKPIILLTAAFAGMAVFIASVFGPLFLTTLGVTDSDLLSIPPTAAATGSVVGSALYVFLRPRLGLNGTFAFSLAAMAAGLATSGLSGSVWPLAAGAAATALGGGAFAPNLNAAAIEASPENPGPALGVVNGVMYGAMILFPIVMNALTAVVGGPGGVLLVYAAGAAAFALVYLLRRR
jgi:MFS family permease